jgi:predicted RND superfamily exporter protein
MKRLALTNFSLKHPWLVLIMVVVAVILFGSQFPKVNFDNDPENMLSEDESVRVFHHETKEKYGLYDFVIVGIVNETDPNGIFNVKTLQRVDRLTKQLLSLRQGDDGLAQVAEDDAGTRWRSLDLSPDSAFKRAMGVVFSHNPNHLFDDDGKSAIIGDELIAPSVVDNIKQADTGALKLEYLMENAPQTAEDALVIRNDAMENPLYKGTLVSEDEKAVGIYIPIIEKTYSYNVASLVKELTKDWPEEDKIYIAGLPVAEDTFGVEMLVQMAISAPLAMLILFLLMYFFFRRVSLILAPLLLAVITVILTMGLLIGLGFDVHIMSSMIPIFIMPIIVCDSIHVLSEFFDSYRKYQNKAETLRHVVSGLFMPMLYTSATTIAGFASLATTPIPPVRVFGLHVAFGVAVGWLLTMTFVPAFISVFISEKSLHRICAVPEHPDQCDVDTGMLSRFLNWVGGFTYRKSWLIVLIATIIMGGSIYGVFLININDNPVKWFGKNHELRVADRVLNKHFGGTYTAYLTLAADSQKTVMGSQEIQKIIDAAQERFAKTKPAALKEFLVELDSIQSKLCSSGECDPVLFFTSLSDAAGKIDEKADKSWNALADVINYMDPDGLTYTTLEQKVQQVKDVSVEDKAVLLESLKADSSVTGEALMDKALDICDSFTGLSLREFVLEMRYVEGLQNFLLSTEKVGKTSSTVDALKKASYELQYVTPDASLAGDALATVEAENNSNFSIPKTAAAIGQVYMQREGMKKKDSLFHMVTRDYQGENIWVQLTSGDNQDMTVVVDGVEKYVAENPPPVPLEIRWAGLTYLNVVWQEKMVIGMRTSLVGSFVVVLIMMLILFRSGLFGILAMLPLTITITFIYGIIGWVGKDYDMPVAILSAMTLGLSVDFAIHFLERGREMYKESGNWKDANARMFREPAKAISRNAIVIAFGFMPLLLAPLIPYRTVGFFLAMIMLVSWLATLFILPALIRILEKWLFKNTKSKNQKKEGRK